FIGLPICGSSPSTSTSCAEATRVKPSNPIPVIAAARPLIAFSICFLPLPCAARLLRGRAVDAAPSSLSVACSPDRSPRQAVARPSSASGEGPQLSQKRFSPFDDLIDRDHALATLRAALDGAEDGELFLERARAE